MKRYLRILIVIDVMISLAVDIYELYIRIGIQNKYFYKKINIAL